MPKLDFGKVTSMKRRWQSSRGNGGIGSVWNSIDKPGICSGNDNYADEGLKGFFSFDMSKDACDNRDSDDRWMGNGCKESNGLSFDNGGCSDQKIGEAANNVRVWLEEHGFSKYASLLQVHEMDEEAQPLLALEDLKKMGTNAFGTQRKISTEIKLLKRIASPW